MIHLRHGTNSIAIPQMWSEISLKQWLEIGKAGEDQTKLVAAITGLTPAVAKRLDVKSKILIADTTRYLAKPFDVKGWIVPKTLTIDGIKINPAIDIKEKQYGQKIVLTMEANKKEPLINNLVTICEIYIQTLLTKTFYDEDKAEHFRALILRDISLVDAYAIATDYIDQLVKVLLHEAKTLNKPPSGDQAAAGISMYDTFGIMNTIRALAGGDILKVPEVLKMDYNTVYLFLLMGKTDAIFNEQYADVMRRKYEK